MRFGFYAALFAVFAAAASPVFAQQAPNPAKACKADRDKFCPLRGDVERAAERSGRKADCPSRAPCFWWPTRDKSQFTLSPKTSLMRTPF